MWWITVFVLSVLVCCWQIGSLYRKWVKNPVVVSFDQQLLGVGDVPFPAVTLCAQVKINDSYVFSYDYADGKMDNLDLLEVASEQCFREVSKELKQNLTDLLMNRTEILKNPFKATWTPRHELLQRCRGILKPETWRCEQGFSRILTQHGVCFTFNLLRRDTILNNNV